MEGCSVLQRGGIVSSGQPSRTVVVLYYLFSCGHYRENPNLGFGNVCLGGVEAHCRNAVRPRGMAKMIPVQIRALFLIFFF